MKAIRQKRINLTSLKLSPEEGFVLSRVDGDVTVRDLVALTGLEEGRVVDIVGRLEAEGAIEVDGAEAAAPPPPPPPPPPPAPPPVWTQASSEGGGMDNELLAFLKDARDRESEPTATPQSEPELELEQVAEDTLPNASAPPSSGTLPEACADDEDPNETEEQLVQREARNEADYRKIFMTVYAQESRDFRIKAALEVTGGDLLALCFDPDPQIIHAVLTNPHAGLPHARMIAFHHRTQIGLESCAKRVDYIKDSLVQRRLLRNPQLPTTILNRIMNSKMLSDIYKSAIDREIPERTRGMVREILRKKFMLASSDEKASLLFRTEGRCLILLVSCTLDAHATTILCSKTNFTILFIQNLARWSATPPALLAHLLKLQVVRRNIGLAKMILKHPNTPSEAKKNFIR